jgi:hypothetical protein
MEIINRIAQSPLITFKIEEYYPKGERSIFDIKDQLFMGLMLKEKDFRAFIKENDWTQYQDKYVAIVCSADAIVPVWAYMLLATKLEGVAKDYLFGTAEELEKHLITKELDKISFEDFKGKPVVIKGCSELPIPQAIYVEVTKRMLPYAQKISYGEPCSTVPVYSKRG